MLEDIDEDVIFSRSIFPLDIWPLPCSWLMLVSVVSSSFELKI